MGLSRQKEATLPSSVRPSTAAGSPSAGPKPLLLEHAPAFYASVERANPAQTRVAAKRAPTRDDARETFWAAAPRAADPMAAFPRHSPRRELPQQPRPRSRVREPRSVGPPRSASAVPWNAQATSSGLRPTPQRSQRPASSASMYGGGPAASSEGKLSPASSPGRGAAKMREKSQEESDAAAVEDAQLPTRSEQTQRALETAMLGQEPEPEPEEFVRAALPASVLRVQLHKRPNTADRPKTASASSSSKGPAWVDLSTGHVPSKLPQRSPISAGGSISLSGSARDRLLAEISAELSTELVADEVLYSAPSLTSIRSSVHSIPSSVSASRRSASIIDLATIDNLPRRGPPAFIPKIPTLHATSYDRIAGHPARHNSAHCPPTARPRSPPLASSSVELPEGFDSMEQYLRFLCYGSKEQPLDRGTATREPHIASKARSVVERVKRAKAARATSPLKPAEPVYARFAQPTVEIPPGLPRMRPFHPSAAPLKHADPAELRAQAEGYAAEIRVVQATLASLIMGETQKTAKQIDSQAVHLEMPRDVIDRAIAFAVRNADD